MTHLWVVTDPPDLGVPTVRHLMLLPLLYACTTDLEAPSEDLAKGHVVYGQDDRIERYQVSDAGVAAAADAVVAVLHRSYLTRRGNNYDIYTGTTLRDDYGVCTSEPFWNQPDPASCSGVMVGEDLVATAGHCVSSSDCSSTRFVFGFRMDSASSVRDTVPLDDVYSCSSIVGRSTGTADWAVVRVDRPIVGHEAVSIRRSGTVGSNAPLILMGHPVGLPLKIAGNANVQSNSSSSTFTSNVDAYSGNSGSPVFHANTMQLEGILVRGNDDWDWTGSCYVSNRCSDGNGCPGFETATRVTQFDQLVPSVATPSCSNDAYENNDSQNNAVQLTPSIYALEICGTSDSDWFSIDLLAGQTLDAVIDFSHASGDLDMELFVGSTSFGVSESTDDFEALSYTASGNTTVDLHIYGYQGAQNAYDLTVDVAGGADFTLAGLAAVDAGDWYTFDIADAPSDEHLTLSVGNPSGSALVSGCGGLRYDIGGLITVNRPWTGALGTASATIRVPSTVRPGVYTFQVAAESSCVVSNSFQLQVR